MRCCAWEGGAEVLGQLEHRYFGIHGALNESTWIRQRCLNSTESSTFWVQRPHQSLGVLIPQQPWRRAVPRAASVGAGP